MTTIKDINGQMNILAPQELSEAWDNDGIMLCESENQIVKKALVCLDVTDAAVEKAKEMNCELIITHHPFIFKPLKAISGSRYSTVFKLFERKLSVLSYHTRLDSAQGGVNDALCEKIGLLNIRPLAAMGRIGELPKETDIYEFCRIVKAALGISGSIKTAFCGKKYIKTVAVVGGAGKDFVSDAESALCDAFLTGELPHNVFLEAKERAMFLLEAGHYYTENPICERLCRDLSQSFPEVEFIKYDIGCPYKEI